MLAAVLILSTALAAPMDFTGRVKTAPSRVPLAAAAGGAVASVAPATIEFEVDERSFLALRKAEKVAVAFALADEDGFPRAAVLTGMDEAIDPKTGTVRFRARVSKPDDWLLAGMFVRVRVAPVK